MYAQARQPHLPGRFLYPCAWWGFDAGVIHRLIHSGQGQRTLGIPADVDMDTTPIDGSNVHDAPQRLHLVESHLQGIKAQQWLPRNIQGLYPLQLCTATDLDLGRGIDLFKVQLQIGIQRAGPEPHRHRAGDVAAEGGKIKTVDLQVQIGLAILRKRSGLRGRIEGAAIEIECQARNDPDLAVCSKVAQERQFQLQLAQLVDFVHRAVIEIDGPPLQRNVVQRKAQW